MSTERHVGSDGRGLQRARRKLFVAGGSGSERSGVLTVVLSNAIGTMRNASASPHRFSHTNKAKVARVGCMEHPDLLRPPNTSLLGKAGSTIRFRIVLDRMLVHLVGRIASWRRSVRDGQMLASYSDRMLHDIGVDRATVEIDSSTSSWRLR